MEAPKREAIIYAGNQLAQVSWKTRLCPRCGANAGQSCRRLIRARVKGKDVGGAYTIRLKNPHDERRRRDTASS